MSTKTVVPLADLRARRTRKWLQKALLELMAEKPFRQIRVTEIADRAEVSRPAFYLHFRTREELLLSHVDVVFEAFHESLAAEIAAGRIDHLRFCVMLFEYWGQYADTLRVVIEADIQSSLRDRLREYFRMLADELREHRKHSEQSEHHDRPSKHADLREFAFDFASGGAMQMLTHWITAGMPHPADHMGALLCDLTRSCI